MKHIAIVVPQFPVQSETFVVTEVNAMCALGHRVSLFCFKHNSSIQSRLDPRIKVFDISSVRLDDTLRMLASRPILTMQASALARAQGAISSRSLMFYGAKLAVLAKRSGCTHIHSHFLTSSLAHGVIAAKLLNIPLSAVGHGHDLFVSPSDLEAKLSACSFTIAVCKNMVGELKKSGARRVELVHCGVDLNTFTGHAAPNNKRLKLLFIGRLVEKKGLKYAIEAISQIPHSIRPDLHIVGQGPGHQELLEQAKSLGIDNRINFLGHRSPKWIREQGKQYDGLIAPFCQAENGDRDTGPVVLKEAMAMGLPVITSRFMGCTEITGDKAGWLVPQKHSGAIRTALLLFIRMNESERQNLRFHARQRVEHYFDAQKQALKLSSLIEGV